MPAVWAMWDALVLVFQETVWVAVVVREAMHWFITDESQCPPVRSTVCEDLLRGFLRMTFTGHKND